MVSGSINKVFLIGNLGANPEVKYILDGVLIAKFIIATSMVLKDKESGEKKTRTEWHRIIAYNKNAELVKEYLKKGSKVFIEGYIKTNTWQGDDGVKKSNIDIVVQNLCLLDRKQLLQSSFSKELLNQQYHEKSNDIVEQGTNSHFPF